MAEKKYSDPRDAQDEAQQPYFEPEDPKAGRKKIRKEDLDALDHWDEPH